LLTKISELSNNVQSVVNAQKETANTTKSNEIIINSQISIDQKLDKIFFF